MTFTSAKKAPLPIPNFDLITCIQFSCTVLYMIPQLHAFKLLFYTVSNIKVTLLKITVNKIYYYLPLEVFTLIKLTFE